MHSHSRRVGGGRAACLPVHGVVLVAKPRCVRVHHVPHCTIEAAALDLLRGRLLHKSDKERVEGASVVTEGRDMCATVCQQCDRSFADTNLALCRGRTPSARARRGASCVGDCLVWLLVRIRRCRVWCRHCHGPGGTVPAAPALQPAPAPPRALAPPRGAAVADCKERLQRGPSPPRSAPPRPVHDSFS